MRKLAINDLGPRLIALGAVIVLLLVGHFTLMFGERALDGYLSMANSAAPSIIPTGVLF
jgi:hypothetical protein